MHMEDLREFMELDWGEQLSQLGPMGQDSHMRVTRLHPFSGSFSVEFGVQETLVQVLGDSRHHPSLHAAAPVQRSVLPQIPHNPVPSSERDGFLFLIEAPDGTKVLPDSPEADQFFRLIAGLLELHPDELPGLDARDKLLSTSIHWHSGPHASILQLGVQWAQADLRAALTKAPQSRFWVDLRRLHSSIPDSLRPLKHLAQARRPLGWIGHNTWLRGLQARRGHYSYLPSVDFGLKSGILGSGGHAKRDFMGEEHQSDLHWLPMTPDGICLTESMENLWVEASTSPKEALSRMSIFGNNGWLAPVSKRQLDSWLPLLDKAGIGLKINEH